MHDVLTEDHALLFGGSGNDALTSVYGSVIGGGGNDSLQSSSFRLWGGGGDDTITGAPGRTASSLGAETTRSPPEEDVTFSPGRGSNRVDGGAARDRISYSTFQAPIAVDLESTRAGRAVGALETMSSSVAALLTGITEAPGTTAFRP
jgi:hypothetical protein